MLAFVVAVFCAGDLETFKKEINDSYAALSDADRVFVAAFENGKTMVEAGVIPLGWFWSGEVAKHRVREPAQTELHVLQVIDAHNMLVENFGTLWISGVETTGFADDRKYDLKSAPLIRRCGTAKYDTALGSTRTVDKYCAAMTADVKTVINGRERIAKSRNFLGIGDATFLENSKGVIRLRTFADAIVERRFSEFPIEEQAWIRKVAK